MGGIPDGYFCPIKWVQKGARLETHPPIGEPLRTSGLAWSLPTKARLPTPPPAPPHDFTCREIISQLVVGRWGGADTLRAAFSFATLWSIGPSADAAADCASLAVHTLGVGSRAYADVRSFMRWAASQPSFIVPAEPGQC